MFSLVHRSNHIRYPYVATEILSSDIPPIHDALVNADNRAEYLQPFWDYIMNKSTEDLGQLNPFVGYWGKIIARLLDRKSDDVRGVFCWLYSSNTPSSDARILQIPKRSN